MSASTSETRELPGSVFTLPRGWQLLPVAEVDASEWVESYLDALPQQPTALIRAHLRFSLMTAIDMLHRLPGTARRNFALIPQPLDGVVRSLLSMQKVQVTGNTYDSLLDRMQNPPAADGLEAINRTVDEIMLPAGRAIVMHDFVVSTDFESVPEPATERATLSLFLDGTDTMLEFAMYAQDLAAFESMTAYLIDLVAVLEKPGAAS